MAEQRNVALTICGSILAAAVGMFVGVLTMRPGRRSNPHWRDGEDTYAEMYSNAVSDVIDRLLEAKDGDRYPWRKLSLTRAKRVWSNYVKLGYVEERDVKALGEIVDRVVQNIVLLDVFTDLGGHGDVNPDDVVELHGGIDPEDPEAVRLANDAFERFGDFILLKGQWIISDYATPALKSLAIKVLEAETPEEQLQLVDRILSVTHQRSDLADLFIEGGRDALEQLGDYGEYPEEGI